MKIISEQNEFIKSQATISLTILDADHLSYLKRTGKNGAERTRKSDFLAAVEAHKAAF